MLCVEFASIREVSSLSDIFAVLLSVTFGLDPSGLAHRRLY